MAELEIGSTLGGDVARLALQVGEGRLRATGMLAIAVRAGLLLDLALGGAIESPTGRDGVALDAGSSQPGSLEVDVTPTGCAAADDLLAHIRRHPARTVDEVLRRGRPHLRAVTRELEWDGHWTRRRRPVARRWNDQDADRFAILFWRLRDVALGHTAPNDQYEAALAAISDALGLVRYRDIDEPVAPQLLAHFGSVAWLGGDVVEYLRAIRIRREMAATPWQTSDG